MSNMSRCLVAACLCAAVPAFAQDDGPSQLDEVVVTGTRITGDEYSGMPAVTITRRADFLAQSVTLVNDTRDADGRRRELHETIRNLVADAAKQGIALGYGEDFLIPVTASSYELPLESRGSNRPDTNEVSLYIKHSIGPTDDVNAAIARLTTFIAKARVVGRTEIDADDDISLSVVNPERYRYEIIPRIAADARKLQAAIGGQCKVNLTGLASRVSWERTDLAELTLYLPYKVELTDCLATP
jgi:hypothetical protein